jgi:hypothetical protein
MGRRWIASLAAALALFAAGAGSASASPAALRILLVEAQCDSSIPAATLRNQMIAQPGVAAVDFFNGALATPGVAQLGSYDVVMAMGDCGWSDRVAIGNNLADYQDQGGVVVSAVFSLRGTDDATVGGRWIDAGYSPYQLDGSDEDGTASLGSHDSSNPLLEGVTSLSAFYRDGTSLTPGATEIAKWSDGISAVAFKGRAIGINANLGDYSGTNIFAGDFARIFVNAGRAYAPGEVSLIARRARARGKIVSLPIGCAPGAACVGAVALDATARKKAATTGRKGRAVHVGDASFSVQANQTASVLVKLTKRGRRALREAGRLAATVTFTTRPAIAGKPNKVSTAKLKIRAKTKK